MTQNEFPPQTRPESEVQRPKNIDAGVLPEQTFANFGLPFELLRSLSSEGVRVPHPINNPQTHFLLGNLYGDGNMNLPEMWELALEVEDEIPKDFWQRMHRDLEGREIVNEILQAEFEYVLDRLGIEVRVRFVDELKEGVEEHFMEVRPFIPKND